MTATPITHETLCDLSKSGADLVLSLFQPTVRATFEEQQNRDRLKTLLARSEPLLAARGLKNKEIDRFLAPARDLIDDGGFWRGRLDGLALYVTRDHLIPFKVPFTLPELVEVSDVPCVRPLVPALASEGHFYVLAISRNLVRLLRATRQDFQEVDLKPLGVPLSLSEALRYDSFERQLQSHATMRADPRLQTHSQAEARAGRHVWSGHASGEEKVKEELGRFFRAFDEGLHKLLATEKAPLVLAAVGYEQDLYRHTSTYRHITPQGIEGNPDLISPADLHASAWAIARRELERPAEAARIAYVEAASPGEASDDLGEILRAAHEGRISSLLLCSGTEVWGSWDYDGRTAKIETHVEAAPLDADLLDLAVRQTLLHGGDVFALDSGAMPTAQPAAAVFRY